MFLALAIGFLPGEAAVDPCTPRLLVLSAFPGEIDLLLQATDVTDVVEVDGRSFFAGTLAGNDVVMGLSGIGLANAERTTRSAFDVFACDGETTISGVVFSGVSGGRTNIGDVTVPMLWTMDDQEFFEVDPEMFAVAKAAAPNAVLTDRVPLGDLACIGLDPGLVETITMPNKPEIHFYPADENDEVGIGKSADPFNGRSFPCIPFGGDVFGCNPCRSPAGPEAPDVQRFIEDAIPFVDPEFFTSYFESPPPATTEYHAEDMETAAVAKVAIEFGIPFIGFRSLSDGLGDPLNLPGFPVQFFVYRQIAADNAAAMTIAFLEAWAAQ
jgi:nucleoside phosphorylase